MLEKREIKNVETKTFKKYRFLSPRVIPETHLSIFPVIVIFLLP